MSFARAEGEEIMQRVITFGCAVLAFGLFASPLSAQQQVGPGEPAPQTQQPTPEAVPPAPPPELETLPPPPPFPPMPSARPRHRWVDMGDRHRSRAHRHARPTRHHATRTHHRRSSAHHRPAHKARHAMHFSKRTIRTCHRMTYRQILRHGSCRALMKQELAATAHRRHHARHKASAHRHKARHHRATRRRKR
jgi:hypothetical protein